MDAVMPGVQSVDRAFAILRCLAGGPSGVSAVAERVGLPKSTVSRLLSTLLALGAVEQSGAEYRIGNGMVDLAAAALPGRNLISVARPHLVELVETLGEAAGLAVLDVNDDVVYLDQVNVDNPVQVRDWTGERLRPHLVSSGLVLLAHLAQPERERYLAGRLEARTPKTTTDAAALRRRLQEVAERGTVWTIDEFVTGIGSVAAPVTGSGGHVVAAVHVHGPSYRFPPPGEEDEVAGVVAGAAERISTRLASGSADEPA